MTTEPRAWQPGDPIYTDQPAELTCSCGVRVLWRPDTPLDCPECGKLLLAAAPAGTGSPTPAPETAPETALPDWERELLERQAAEEAKAAQDESGLSTGEVGSVVRAVIDPLVERMKPRPAVANPTPAPEPLDVDDLLYRAWGVIANAGQGDWAREGEAWTAAATAWRDAWHARLDAQREQAGSEAHNDDCGSCCCCSVDSDRLRAELSQVQKERDDAKAALRKISAGVDTSDAVSAADVADAVIQDRNERILRVSATGHDSIAAVVAERDEAYADLNLTRLARDTAEAALAALRTEVGPAIEALERVGCQFEFCKGETLEPIDMVTCYVCATLARLRALVTDQSPAAPEGRAPKVALRAVQDLREGLALRGIDPPHWRGAVRAALAEIDRLRALLPTSDTQTSDGSGS